MNLIEKATIITDDNKKLLSGNVLYEELASKGYTLSKWIAKQIKDLNLKEGVNFVKLTPEQIIDHKGRFVQGSEMQIGFPYEVGIVIMARYEKTVSLVMENQRLILDELSKQKKSLKETKDLVKSLNQELDRLKQLNLEKKTNTEDSWQQELITLFSYTNKPMLQEHRLNNPKGSFIRIDMCRTGSVTKAYELKSVKITKEMVVKN